MVYNESMELTNNENSAFANKDITPVNSGRITHH